MKPRTAISSVLLFALGNVVATAGIAFAEVADTGCDAISSPLCKALDADAALPGGKPARRFLPPDFDDTAKLTPLILSVPRPPQAVRATDGQFHLVYELQIANIGSFTVKRPPTPTPPATLEVTDVAVFGDDDRTPLLVLKGKDLAARMQLVRLGIAPPTVKLQEGQSGVVFLDVTLPNRKSIPKRITNRARVAAVPGTGDPPAIVLTEFAVDVDQTPVIVIGPFLRGGPWANFNGCCDFATPHRRIARAVNGSEFWPERYAVDLLKVEPVGGQIKVYKGDGSRVGDWFSTGEDLLAVADGVVTRVVRGLPNNAIGDSPYPPVTSTGGGNEVLLYLGEGIFVMYGHMFPGTVAVRVGDRVHRGDVLGKLGNTGQSTAPHLHFQVMDNNSIGAAQGLPWVLDRFILVGTFDDLDDAGALTGVTPVNAVRREELPLQQTLFRLP